MAKRLHSWSQNCSAALLSFSLLLTGCQVDIQDPNAATDETQQPGDTTSTTPTAPTNSAPVITLVGDATMTVPLNAAFAEPGVAATDAEDGDLSLSVFSDSMRVNTSVAGQYEVTYRVTDSNNLNAAPIKRLVIVAPAAVEPAAPIIPVEPVATVEALVVSTVPAITNFRLVGITATKEIVDLKTLENSAIVDLSQIAIDKVNVVADSADVSKTGSVHFKLTGPTSIDRYENGAIYTMAVQSTSLSLAQNQLPVGSYSLSVTPYALPDMAGTKGVTKTVSFKVVDKMIVSTVPKIAALDLVVVNDANGAYLPVSRLAEGSEVDLATLAGKLANVIAISEDASKTGSVEFSLDGPVSIQRTENNAAYALANESEHLDINGGELPAGDYTLIVTPYAEANAAGEAGIPLLLNFSVTGQVAPPVADPQAVNDSYSLTAGSGSQPGQSRAVSSNDVFESGAVFTITKAPINGTATMFDLGFFTYEPKAGFTGTDTFTYQISQGGKTASATASVSVVAPVTGTSAGFTAIKPSADSKLIYVSSSVGKDTNACLTEAAPCKTVSAGMEKMRAGYPDHLYLKRGDVWRDELLKEFVSGRSAAEPSVLGFYGTSGARPRLESAQNLLHAFTLKNANFIGVEFSNHTKVSGSASFTGTGKGDIVFLGPVSNVLIEDCVFNHIEFIAQKWTTGNPTNISLRRNIWTGAYYNETSYHRNSRPSNVYAEGVMGLLIEENVFDFGGWHPSVKGASANMFNHNLYLQAGSDGNKLVLRNNIISRGSSHGAQLRSGGLAEDNFFGRNAIGLLVGYEKTALPAGTRAHLKNNVVSEGHSMFKGTNPCAGGNGVLWNHLCTGAVFGINIDVHGAADYVSTGNIVSGRATGDDKWKQFTSGLQARSYVIQRITDADKSRTVVESGNIAWHWSNATEGDGNGYKNPGLTLADYNASLGGTKSYDEFMNKVKTRPLQSWDVKYTAKSVNQYIRAGFAK